MQSRQHRRFLKPLAVTVVILIAVASAVLVREYLLLRRLAESFAPAKNETASAEKTFQPEHSPPILQDNTRLVYDVRNLAGGSRIEARVSFKAFKRMVEANPRLVQTWGRIGWKVLGDVPALCLRSVAPGTAFTRLGVQSGDCVTHLDGESVNQPLRNLGIWLTLGSRKNLRIDTLRGRQRISYHLAAH